MAMALLVGGLVAMDLYIFPEIWGFRHPLIDEIPHLFQRAKNHHQADCIVDCIIDVQNTHWLVD